jgi:hypothetical protein
MVHRPRLRIRALLLGVALLAITFGLLKAVRVYAVRLAPQSEQIIQRYPTTVTVRVSTGEAYLPGVDQPTAMIAVVMLAGIAVAWRFRHRHWTEPHGRVDSACRDGWKR